MRNLTILSFSVLLGLCANVMGAPIKKQSDPELCERTADPQRITVRHIEGKGIGYGQGYTTLEGFFSMRDLCREKWLLFFDGRFHVFNNAKLAGNAGLGFRYLKWNRIWGVNGYYDVRQGHKRVYNQMSLGLESLGTIWDFRANGYLPFDEKRSPFLSTSFDKFEGHSMILRRKYDFAMGGFNGEAGVHLNRWQKLPIYLAAGPYYLLGRGKAAWGGESRLSIDAGKYVRLEGNVSYDHIFKWIGQGQLSLMFSFGAKKRTEKECEKSSCLSTMLDNRFVQKVDRSEIIPLDHSHKYTPAIDPSTGKPYYFVFVDNESHSEGTWESPYPTLSAATAASHVGDIIYVLPGSGATYLGGITLLDNQRLWGSGIAYRIPTQVGSVAIPAQSTTFPNITMGGPTTTPAVEIANSCEVAGLHLTGITGVGNVGAPIKGDGFTHAFIHNNLIDTVDNVQAFIYLANCDGTVRVTNNFLSSGGINGASGIVIDDSVASDITVNAVINQNTLLNLLSGDGIAIASDVDSMGGGNTVLASIKGNVLQNINSNGDNGLFGFGSGIGIYSDIGGAGNDVVNATISKNALRVITGGSLISGGFTFGAACGSGIAIYTNLLEGGGSDEINATISKNSLDTIFGGSFIVDDGDASGISGGSGIGIYTNFASNGSNQAVLRISKNTLNTITGGDINTISGMSNPSNFGVAGGSGIAVYTDLNGGGGSSVITSIIKSNTLNAIRGGTPSLTQGVTNFGVAGGSGIGLYTALNGNGGNTVTSTLSKNILNEVTGGGTSIIAEILTTDTFTGNFGVAGGSGIGIYADFETGGGNLTQLIISENQLNGIVGASPYIDAFSTDSGIHSIGSGGVAGGSGIAIYVDLSGDGGNLTEATISENTLTAIFGGSPTTDTSGTQTMSYSGSGSGGVAGGSGIAVYTDLSGVGSDETEALILRNAMSGIFGGNVVTDAGFATAPFTGSGGTAGGSGIAVYTDLGSPNGGDIILSTIKGNTLSRVTGGDTSTNSATMSPTTQGSAGAAGGSGIAVYTNLFGAGNDTANATIANNSLLNTQGGTVTTEIGTNFGVAGGGGISIYSDLGGNLNSFGGANIITGAISNNTLSNTQGGDAISPFGDNDGAVGGSGIGTYTNIYGNGSDQILGGSVININSLLNVQGGSTETGGSQNGVAAGTGILDEIDLNGGTATMGSFTQTANSETNIQPGFAD